jgi:hypothetical protein
METALWIAAIAAIAYLVIRLTLRWFFPPEH